MMTTSPIPTAESDAQAAILQWAVEREVEANLSVASGGRWMSLRTHFMRFDPAQGIIQVAVDAPEEGSSPSPGLPPQGERVGVSFRRGHKKCLFVSTLIMSQSECGKDGIKRDTLVLRVPRQVRSIQRRAFQRVIVPEGVFIAAKIWEGGIPEEGSMSFPVCSGRVANVSMGGVLVETRVDQNPRLSSGEVVGVEIAPRPGESIVLDGMYRHCVTDGRNRLGLGFHFPGIEHELPGRASITQLSDFIARVRSMQR